MAVRRAPSGYHWSQHQRAHPAKAGVDGAKTQIAGGEIVLLEIQRVVGDVHLAIHAGQLALGIQGDGGVVIKPGGTAFKERGDEDDAELARQLSEALC